MHNNTPIVPYVSLCSGYEGIGLGLHRCIPNLRCVAYCEREAFAIANLVAKMENGLLDAAPVFTDVTNFPWADFAPYMAGGILSFGWPCQPVSCAGKRKATEDERWLFDIIADGIALMRPGILFAENVEGLLSAKMPDGSLVFAHCIERLESLHYKVAAGIFSASEVGAPHQRKRVFILAVSNSLGGAAGLSRSLAWNEGVAGVSDNGGGEGCGELADAQLHGCHNADQRPNQHGVEGALGKATAKSTRWSGFYSSQHRQAVGNGQVWPSRPGEPQHGWEPPRVVVDAKSQRAGQRSELRSEECGSRGALPWDIEQSGEVGGISNASHNGLEIDSECAIQPAEGRGRNGNAGRVCSREAMGHTDSPRPQERQGQRGAGIQGIDSHGGADAGGQAQPSLGRDADGIADGLGYAELQVACDNRTDELRLLGNGVVPATATRAFLTLLQELTK